MRRSESRGTCFKQAVFIGIHTPKALGKHCAYSGSTHRTVCCVFVAAAIHLSEATKLILEETSSFRLELRGQTKLKASPERVNVLSLPSDPRLWRRLEFTVVS